MLHLDFREGKPIFQQLADGIRQQISSGILRGGEMLPTVRDLAAELSINPTSIQRAYTQLEMEGWVAAVEGQGVFVRGSVESDLQREKRLMDTFCASARELLTLGYTREELLRQLDREEHHD